MNTAAEASRTITTTAIANRLSFVRRRRIATFASCIETDRIHTIVCKDRNKTGTRGCFSTTTIPYINRGLNRHFHFHTHDHCDFNNRNNDERQSSRQLHVTSSKSRQISSTIDAINHPISDDTLNDPNFVNDDTDDDCSSADTTLFIRTPDPSTVQQSTIQLPNKNHTITSSNTGYGRVWKANEVYNVEHDSYIDPFGQYWNRRVVDDVPDHDPTHQTLTNDTHSTSTKDSANPSSFDASIGGYNMNDADSDLLIHSQVHEYQQNQPSTQNTSSSKESIASSTDTTSGAYPKSVEHVVNRIMQCQGGEMRQRGLGVLHADPAVDLQLLTDNYTVKAVASALRDREDALQQAAVLAADDEKIDELRSFLQIFHPKYVLERRKQQKNTPIVENTSSSSTNGETNSDTNSRPVTMDPVLFLHSQSSRNVLRKALMRMPRTVTTAHTKRAGVCVALCTCDNVPSILLERRATNLRNFPGEVCLPGGMVCDIQDRTIVSTSIREMNEEIGGLNYTADNIEVLGILRLNWGEVQYLTGVAVTPVVCYLGELPKELYPNPDEVSEVFTIPLIDLLNRQLWIHREGLAPIFIGGPHVIWGLTGYVLERLAKDILLPSHT